MRRHVQPARLGDTDKIEEIVNEFLQSWDGMDNKKGQVWVVGATNLYERIDSAIIRRFGATVEIGLPEAPQRMEILRLEMKKFGRDAEIPEIAGPMTQGLSGGILKEVAKAVCSEAAGQKSAPTPEIWKKVIPEFVEAGNTAVEAAPLGTHWPCPTNSSSNFKSPSSPCAMSRSFASRASSLRAASLVRPSWHRQDANRPHHRQ